MRKSHQAPTAGTIHDPVPPAARSKELLVERWGATDEAGPMQQLDLA